MVENRVPAVRRVLGRAGQAGAAGVLFAVLAGGPALAQAAPPPPPSVKYYIVPHADNPDDITLFKIAERALGDGKRFPEIFRLNQGRPRPDGTPFTDPATIEPGQVLQLPDDAEDPAVRFGPLPATPPVKPVTPITPVVPPVQRADEPSGLGVGLASAVSGSGGLLTGLLAGLWWRRRPQIVPPPPFEPPPSSEPPTHEEADDGSGSVSGTLPLPIVVPAPRPDVVLRPEPITAEHSIIVLDTAETQVIAAIRPGGQFRFRFEKDPGFADSSTVLVVDDEGNRS